MTRCRRSPACSAPPWRRCSSGTSLPGTHVSAGDRLMIFTKTGSRRSPAEGSALTDRRGGGPASCRSLPAAFRIADRSRYVRSRVAVLRYQRRRGRAKSGIQLDASANCPVRPARAAPAVASLHARPAMLACVRTAAVFGIEAVAVHVEVDVSFGLPSFTMVGLPDASVRESRDRVRERDPQLRLRVSRRTASPSTWRRPTCGRRAPRSTCRSRSAFSPPRALSSAVHVDDVVLLGELSLDGVDPAGAGRAADRGGRATRRR